MAEETEEAPPHYLGHRQRLRERFLAAGGEALPDYELLELLLCVAVPRKDMKPLAKALMARFGSFAGVISAEPQALREIAGLGETSVVALKVVREAAIRLARQQVLKRPVIATWDALMDYVLAALGHAQQEEFHLLFLDRKGALIADECQQKGTIDHTPVYPREVVKRALEVAASSVIMVHNHPSGDPKPSKGDIEMTRTVRDALKMVSVTLHDHIVVGRGSYVSFKSQELL
ncbi:MAG: DNA repair protein RadC [Rhodospirillales bacterium]|nr:DNA repair protein RadC [Rhodospirillales bacterium]